MVLSATLPSLSLSLSLTLPSPPPPPPRSKFVSATFALLNCRYDPFPPPPQLSYRVRLTLQSLPPLCLFVTVVHTEFSSFPFLQSISYLFLVERVALFCSFLSAPGENKHSFCHTFGKLYSPSLSLPLSVCMHVCL